MSESCIIAGVESVRNFVFPFGILLSQILDFDIVTLTKPLDVVKTRMQKQVIYPGKEPKERFLLALCKVTRLVL